MDTLLHLLPAEPLLQTLLALGATLLGAWLARVVAEALLRRVAAAVVKRTRWRWDDALLAHGFLHRAAQILTPLLVQYALPLVPGLSTGVALVLHNLASAVAILYVALALGTALDTVNALYTGNGNNRARSIKSYVQVGKLLAFSIAAIAIVAALIDKSPLILLSGLGAMSAVLLLVFRDTLLSFVAAIQLGSNDMLRVGDWIEMPQVGADGGVIDIALHTVKVQNWDKTITTIPTWRLISESYKNWRGMQESGGRRIKRSLRIDTHSVHFLHDDELAQLRRLALLDGYLQEKCSDVAATNRHLGTAADYPANQRRLTNLGTFRAYALAYLQQRSDIHRDMFCMVRLLEPGAEGVPLEIYCFTATTAWVEYERIQGDVFDHLIAILPVFGLRLFQNPAGADLRAFAAPHPR